VLLLHPALLKLMDMLLHLPQPQLLLLPQHPAHLELLRPPRAQAAAAVTTAATAAAAAAAAAATASP
jgi:hypothetical protein